MTSLGQSWKPPIVKLLGRERANALSAPYHDWLARRRTRRFLRSLPGSGLRVNLGCGYRPLPGWINVDLARGPRVEVVCDLRKRLPFASESCAAIFSEHVIEHLSRSDGEALLRECLRMLQPGGVLRLSTPDAARFLRSYAGDGRFLSHPSFADAIHTPMDRINKLMREHGQHLWVYDAPALILALKRAGFLDVTERPCGDSRCPEMRDIDCEDRAFESLYVEAVK